MKCTLEGTPGHLLSTAGQASKLDQVAEGLVQLHFENLQGGRFQCFSGYLSLCFTTLW